jgi:hypothetical protein
MQGDATSSAPPIRGQIALAASQLLRQFLGSGIGLLPQQHN